MPEYTAELPHAITCIKDSVQDLLKQHCGDDLTISCDRDDCWNDNELFKWRQAVNIVSGSESIGETVKTPRGKKSLADLHTESDSVCSRQATLNIDIQIYVEQCDCDEDDDDCDCLNAKGKAYSILAHIQSVLFSNKSQLLGRRILYTGSFPSTNSENETDVAVVTGSFEIHYLFDPTQPWVVG